MSHAAGTWKKKILKMMPCCSSLGTFQMTWYPAQAMSDRATKARRA